jgi:hypothetical protein
MRSNPGSFLSADYADFRRFSQIRTIRNAGTEEKALIYRRGVISLGLPPPLFDETDLFALDTGKFEVPIVRNR